MRFNVEVDWPTVFRGFISRESLADPSNPKRHLFFSTMLFVEAGFLELDDQVLGRSEVRKKGLAWAKITRDLILARAKDLLAELRKKPADKLPPELSPEVLREVKVTLRCFRERWDNGVITIADYFMCMTRYACVDARWRQILDRGPQQAMASLPRVRRGESSLAELIAEIATQDLKRWTRVARGWLFPLLITMDATLKSVGHQAYHEMLDAYSRLWEPVYQAGLAQLGVQFRPDIDASVLNAMISAQISGFALRIAGNGAYTDRDAELFSRSVQALIYAAIDQGGHEPVPRALDGLLDRRSP